MVDKLCQVYYTVHSMQQEKASLLMKTACLYEEAKELYDGAEYLSNHRRQDPIQESRATERI